MFWSSGGALSGLVGVACAFMALLLAFIAIGLAILFPFPGIPTLILSIWGCVKFVKWMAEPPKQNVP